MVALGNKLVVFGGNADPRRLTSSGGPPKKTCILNDVHVFDTETATWRLMQFTTSIPTPRYAHAAVVLSSSRMLIYGGHDGANWLDETAILNLERGSWAFPHTQGRNPGPRHGHTLTDLGGGRFFLFGGYCNETYFNDLHLLEVIPGPNGDDNEAHCRWTPVECTGSHPTPRAYHTATLIDNNYLLIFGGRGFDGGFLQDVVVYEISTRHWFSPIFSTAAPVGRAHHTAVLWGSRVMLFAGQDSSGWLSDLHVLQNGKWYQPHFPGSQPLPRSRHTATVIGNMLYIFGGYNGKDWMNDLYQLDLDYGQQQYEIQKLRSRIDVLEGRVQVNLPSTELEELEQTLYRSLFLISKAKTEALRREYEDKLERVLEEKGITSRPHTSALSPAPGGGTPGIAGHLNMSMIPTAAAHRSPGTIGPPRGGQGVPAAAPAPSTTFNFGAPPSPQQQQQASQPAAPLAQKAGVRFGYVDQRFYSREQGGGGGVPSAGAAPLGLGWDVLGQERQPLDQGNESGAGEEDRDTHGRRRPYAVVGQVPEGTRVQMLREAGASDLDIHAEAAMAEQLRQQRSESIRSPTQNPLYLASLEDH
eukprot:TRINITY_DN7514_c0_g1_i2.p1 TRINITY_DN7514_c0_g1~~TRINITY_DN7514_c0_g1_i2.p1  ORF type:complete len:596 (-),score=116.32 TRINITY_DN7514_c0_g1_i2:192-1949(-)